jgi:hypothetical protein
MKIKISTSYPDVLKVYGELCSSSVLNTKLFDLDYNHRGYGETTIRFLAPRKARISIEHWKHAHYIEVWRKYLDTHDIPIK